MREIKLTQGQVALVDDADFDHLNQWKWCAFKSGKKIYAIRGVKSGGETTLILMHRLILGIIDPKIHGDHKDGNGLNNQKSNLRVATNQENSRNRDASNNRIYKGVFWDKARNKWMAAIVVNKRQHYLGRFSTMEAAAAAYNEAAIKYHGEFARLNVITD